jgi:hypothetical protein
MNEITLPSRHALLDGIDRLEMGADAKVLLGRLLNTTATIAGRAVEIGRHILAFVLESVKMFPNTTFGVIIGATMAVLIGSMAVLGAVLGPMLGPLLVALGMGAGAVLDMQDGALRARIATLEREFGEIAGG